MRHFFRKGRRHVSNNFLAICLSMYVSIYLLINLFFYPLLECLFWMPRSVGLAGRWASELQDLGQGCGVCIVLPRTAAAVGALAPVLFLTSAFWAALNWLLIMEHIGPLRCLAPISKFAPRAPWVPAKLTIKVSHIYSHVIYRKNRKIPKKVTVKIWIFPLIYPKIPTVCLK